MRYVIARRPYVGLEDRFALGVLEAEHWWPAMALAEQLWGDARTLVVLPEWKCLRAEVLAAEEMDWWANTQEAESRKQPWED